MERQAQQGRRERRTVGAIIFDQGRALKSTRAAAAGMVEVPLRGRDTFVSSRVRTWNSSEALPAGHA
jgi:hypothetical protein